MMPWYGVQLCAVSYTHLKIDDTNKLYIEDINDAVVMDILFDSKQVLECTKELQTEMYDYCVIRGESLTYGFVVLVCEGNNKVVYYCCLLYTSSTQQGAAATPAVFNAYQQAQQARDAQLAAANPGLYTCLLYTSRCV